VVNLLQQYSCRLFISFDIQDGVNIMFLFRYIVILSGVTGIDFFHIDFTFGPGTHHYAQLLVEMEVL
jgi:hypothetical protein